MWVLDANGTTTFANEQLARMLGRPAEKLIGASVSSFLAGVGSGLAAARIAAMGLGVAKRFDASFVRPDGTRLWTMLSLTPVHDVDGRMTGAVAMVTDISERRRAELGLRAAGPPPPAGSERFRTDPVAQLATRSATGDGDRMTSIEDLHAAAHDRLALGADLRRAELGSDMRLHYQPMVDLRDGHLTGFEALLRWTHPEHGMIMPIDFIQLAEETQAIVEIGRWVIAEACRQSRLWQQRYPARAGMVMNVNVSPVQLADPDIVRDVARALEMSGLDPSLLTLEITETTISPDESAVVDTLQRLKHLGVRISVDDFGTADSSVGNLDWCPIDELKIDRSFVARLGGDSDDADSAVAVIGLARSLEVDVVAQGIEREDQLVQLSEAGCSRGQGYYFWRPLDIPAVEVLLGETPPAVLPPAMPFVMQVTNSSVPSGS